MSEPYAEGGIQDSEFGMPIETISVLDTSELAYFDACADYAEKPNQNNLDKIRDFSIEQAMMFSKVLGTIADENTCDDYAKECEALFREKESRRVDFLNAITGGESFWVTTVGMPDENDNEISDETAAMQYVLDYWTKRNSSSLEYDTNQLISLVKDSPAAERLNRNEALKQHALDVAKIALGASAAILFTSRFRR